MTSSKDLTLGVALAIITGALWGLVFLAPALASAFPPLMLVAGRYIAYGLIALVVMIPRWSQVRPLLTLKNLIIAFGLAIAGNTLYYLLLANAILLAGVPISTLIIGFIPVTVALIGCLRKDALPIRRFYPALLLGTAAIGLITLEAISSGANQGSSAPVFGLLLAICALACWTVFAVGNSLLLERRPSISAQDWNLILGVVTGFQGFLVLPFALVADLPSEAEVWLHFLAVTIAIAFLASFVANALWNKVSQLLPLTLIGPLVLFETLFALLYGFAWEQRLPSSLELAAIVMLIASVTLSVRAHRHRAQPAHP